MPFITIYWLYIRFKRSRHIGDYEHLRSAINIPFIEYTPYVTYTIYYSLLYILGQLLVYLNKHDEAINVVSNYLSVLSDSDTPNIAKMVESIYNLGTHLLTI